MCIPLKEKSVSVVILLVRSFVLGAVLEHNRTQTSRAWVMTLSHLKQKSSTRRKRASWFLKSIRKLCVCMVKRKTRWKNRLIDWGKHYQFRILYHQSRSRVLIVGRFYLGSGWADRRDPEADWRFLDRSHGDLALFSTPNGMVALHLRAAFERVRFEQLEDSLKETEPAASQSLLLPEPIEFDGIDRSNLETSLPKLRHLGFVLEEFGRNFYRMEGCPHWIDPENAVLYLRDFLEISRESGGRLHLDSFVREALEKQSHYGKEGKYEISEDEIVHLVTQLLGCRNPYVCPRGRPVYFEIPKRDFETRFKRKL